MSDGCFCSAVLCCWRHLSAVLRNFLRNQASPQTRFYCGQAAEREQQIRACQSLRPLFLLVLQLLSVCFQAAETRHPPPGNGNVLLRRSKMAADLEEEEKEEVEEEMT